ncbi:MAG: putative hydro-lyase [Bacillota bacterium]|nr:putative hydro-lyase [Bacillota bacterium]
MDSLRTVNPSDVRTIIRMGEYSKPTSGLCPGYAQANLVVLPKDLALDFMIFVQRNPKPCPVLDITEAGNPDPKKAAPGADIRTDIPLYRVYKKGELVDEPTDILSYWREDLVAFLLGCSFTFEKGLLKAGIPVRHIEEGCNVPMYITNIECMKGGIFQGPMVVSMRPIPGRLIPEAVRCTSRYPAVHGTPVHVGAPEEIGIKDIDKPDFGDRVTIKKGEIPVFWACGVTPQAVAMKVKPELMITHSPGHMFITDIREEELEI